MANAFSAFLFVRQSLLACELERGQRVHGPVLHRFPDKRLGLPCATENAMPKRSITFLGGCRRKSVRYAIVQIKNAAPQK